MEWIIYVSQELTRFPARQRCTYCWPSWQCRGSIHPLSCLEAQRRRAWHWVYMWRPLGTTIEVERWERMVGLSSSHRAPLYAKPGLTLRMVELLVPQTLRAEDIIRFAYLWLLISSIASCTSKKPVILWVRWRRQEKVPKEPSTSKEQVRTCFFKTSWKWAPPDRCIVYVVRNFRFVASWRTAEPRYNGDCTTKIIICQQYVLQVVHLDSWKVRLDSWNILVVRSDRRR